MSAFNFSQLLLEVALRVFSGQVELGDPPESHSG